MPQTYVPERQTEFWTSTQLQRRLEEYGYEVLAFPLTQGWERDLPADFVFLAANDGIVKLFGLQYKALYRNGSDHWVIERRQHADLRPFRWIYYCLSETRSFDEAPKALDVSQFRTQGNVHPPRTDLDATARYTRWGPFFRNLEACRVGARIDSLADFNDVVDARVGAQLINRGLDVVVVNLLEKRVLVGVGDRASAPPDDDAPSRTQ